MIELRHLRYFLAVARSGNIGRAALALHISQPPLSRQIRQLEQCLGVELFIRGAAGVTLTAAGRAFAPEAERTLLQAEKACAAARAAGKRPGTVFRLGYSSVFDRSIFPDVRPYFLRHFPDVTLQEQVRHSVRLIDDIREGRLDAAFIGLHTEARDLTVVTLREEPMLVALPAAHRLAARRRIGFDELAGESLFWFARRLNPGFYDYCQAIFERIGFRPARLPEPADHHVLLGLIAEGRGLALVAQSMRHLKREGVVLRPLKGDAKLSMGIALAYAPDNDAAGEASPGKELSSDASPLLPGLLAFVRQASQLPRKA